MLQLPRRWKSLTAVLAVAAYIINNYHIEGLEKLQIKPRTPSEIAARQASGNAWSPDVFGEFTQLQSPNTSGSSFPSTMFQSGNQGIPAEPLSTSTAGFNSHSTAAFQPQNTPQSFSSPSTLAAAPLLNPMQPTPQPSGLNSLIASGETDLGRMLSVGEKLAIWEDKNAGTATISGAVTGRPSTLRIASFHIPSLGSTKLAKAHVFEIVVRVLRKFDVVALQGIQSSRDDILPLIVERLNQSGRSYDYMIGPRVGRGGVLEQFAFVFDTSRVETDRFQLYTVDDPEDLITREPMVAWFRAREVASQNAFTFSMINVAIEPDFADRERQILPNLISAIEQDGRGEDDWILAGDFAGGDAEIQSLTSHGIRLALIGVPTTTDGSRMLDDIAFPGIATVEFTGKAGAFDFLRQFNLTIEQALEVSEHMPIWAEFSTQEGSDPGRLAPVANSIH